MDVPADDVLIEMAEPMRYTSLFRDFAIHRFHLTVRWSTDEYLAFVGTQSRFTTLPEERRAALAAELRRICDSPEFRSMVDRPYVTVLYLART